VAAPCCAGAHKGRPYEYTIPSDIAAVERCRSGLDARVHFL
jgi:hypothetical protein